jgi:hypothetical protein
MHTPVTDDRIWINGRRAAPVVDVANAAYSAMLRCLVALYDTPSHDGERRQALLGAALSCMKVVTTLGSCLTELPAQDAEASPRAGMSFAMLRATEGLVSDGAPAMLAERLSEIGTRIPDLGLRDSSATGCVSDLLGAADALRRTK